LLQNVAIIFTLGFVEVKLEMKKKTPMGKSWKWDLVVQQWIGYKIKWKI
jgi:hypothetical protein